MTPRVADWVDVRVGAYVKDKNGTTWRVEARREPCTFLLQDRDGLRVTVSPAPLDPVTVLEPTEGEALGLVMNELQGTLIAIKPKGKPFILPLLNRAALEQHGHMFQFHGVWTKDEKKLDKIAAMHTADHLAGGAHAYIPHEHRSLP